MACGSARKVLIGDLAVEREYLVNNAERVFLKKDVFGELLQLRLPSAARLFQFHQHRGLRIMREARDVDDQCVGLFTADEWLDDRAQLEQRARVFGQTRLDSRDHHWN